MAKTPISQFDMAILGETAALIWANAVPWYEALLNEYDPNSSIGKLALHQLNIVSQISTLIQRLTQTQSISDSDTNKLNS